MELSAQQSPPPATTVRQVRRRIWDKTAHAILWEFNPPHQFHGQRFAYLLTRSYDRQTDIYFSDATAHRCVDHFWQQVLDPNPAKALSSLGITLEAAR